MFVRVRVYDCMFVCLFGCVRRKTLYSHDAKLTAGDKLWHSACSHSIINRFLKFKFMLSSGVLILSFVFFFYAYSLFSHRFGSLCKHTST